MRHPESTQGYRVYSAEGSSITLNASNGGVGAKTGLYAVTQGNGSAQTRVYSADGVSPTIIASDWKKPKKVAMRITGDTQRTSVYDPKGQSPTLTATDYKTPTTIATGAVEDGKGVILIDGVPHNIRRLTPRECFRLQGFSDDMFDKIEGLNSKTQLYKQAGNAVTATVAYELGLYISVIANGH